MISSQVSHGLTGRPTLATQETDMSDDRPTTQNDRLLAVDDEAGIRVVLESVLTESGYECLTAGSVREALSIVAQGDIRLVLTDLRMPDEDGIDLLRELQRSYPDIGVVMVTGVNDIRVAMEAVSLGAYDYVSKPFQMDELLVRVDKALERHRLLRENEQYQRNLERLVRERTADLEKRMVEMAALNKMYQRYLESDLDTEAKFTSLSRSVVDIAAKLESLISETEQRRVNDLSPLQ